MNLIAAVDENWGIGYRNDLLVSIPSDKKFFREMTTGKVVVMGRKTLESFPGGMPLKNRTNVVLSANPEYHPKGVQVCRSFEELRELLRGYESEDIYVIGGGSVYSLLLPYCSLAHITRIDHRYTADTWLPDLDADPEWEITGESEEQTYFDLEYRFVRYERRKDCPPLPL